MRRRMQAAAIESIHIALATHGLAFGKRAGRAERHARTVAAHGAGALPQAAQPRAILRCFDRAAVGRDAARSEDHAARWIEIRTCHTRPEPEIRGSTLRN